MLLVSVLVVVVRVHVFNCGCVFFSLFAFVFAVGTRFVLVRATRAKSGRTYCDAKQGWGRAGNC